MAGQTGYVTLQDRTARTKLIVAAGAWCSASPIPAGPPPKTGRRAGIRWSPIRWPADARPRRCAPGIGQRGDVQVEPLPSPPLGHEPGFLQRLRRRPGHGTEIGGEPATLAGQRNDGIQQPHLGLGRKESDQHSLGQPRRRLLGSKPDACRAAGQSSRRSIPTVRSSAVGAAPISASVAVLNAITSG